MADELRALNRINGTDRISLTSTPWKAFVGYLGPAMPCSIGLGLRARHDVISRLP